MTRRRRRRTLKDREQNSIQKESLAELKETEKLKEDLAETKQSEEEKETYPDPREEERKLLEKAEEFLKKHTPLEDKKDVINDKSGSNKKHKKPTHKKKTVKRIVLHLGPYHFYYIIFIAVAIFVMGCLLGYYIFSITNGTQDSSDNLDSSVIHVDEKIQKDLALSNLENRSGFTIQVVNIDERSDGWYVTFRAVNNTSDPVYFMANTIKLIGKNGEIIGPELYKGNVPKSFSGQGLHESDKATLVFRVPSTFEADYFLIENITNMKHGHWSMKVDLPSP